MISLVLVLVNCQDSKFRNVIIIKLSICIINLCDVSILNKTEKKKKKRLIFKGPNHKLGLLCKQPKHRSILWPSEQSHKQIVPILQFKTTMANILLCRNHTDGLIATESRECCDAESWSKQQKTCHVQKVGGSSPKNTYQMTLWTVIRMWHG